MFMNLLVLILWIMEDNMSGDDLYSLLLSDNPREQLLRNEVVLFDLIPELRVCKGFELKFMPWDYAAASLILKEAGGKITDISGEELQYENSTSVIASNGVEDYLKYIL